MLYQKSTWVALASFTAENLVGSMSDTSYVYSATAAPTRDPREATPVLSLLRSTPRLCCGSSKSFDASRPYYWVDTAVVVGVGGLCGACLVAHGLWLVCRRCVWSCQRSSHFLSKRKLQASFRQRLCAACLMGVALAGVAFGTVGAQGLLAGGLNRGRDAARDLEARLEEVEALCDETASFAVEAAELAALVTCESGESLVQSSANAWADAAVEARDQTESTSNEASLWSRRTASSRRRLDLGLLAFVGITHAALLPSTAYGTALSRRWALWLAARLGFALCVGIAALVALEFGVGVELADFCRRPDRHFVDLVHARAHLEVGAADLVAYYATCHGENPLGADVDAASTGLAALNATLAAVDQACAPKAAVDRIQALVDAAKPQLAHLRNLVDCPPINAYYQRLVHSATCKYFLSGLYALAVTHAAFLALLFLFLFLADWVCETILLEEEFWLLPNPEIFALGSYQYANTNQIDIEINDHTSGSPTGAAGSPTNGRGRRSRAEDRIGGDLRI